MTLLPPTVHERLAQCGTRVLLTGLHVGAEVTLTIDGADTTFIVTGPSRTVTVPPLVGNTDVVAEQVDASGPSGPSPTVVVEDVSLPPASTPSLPLQVGWCSQCVHVGGLVPGCRVELFEEGNLVGDGLADRGGSACVKVDLRGRNESGRLDARMIVCGQDGPFSSTSIVVESVLPKPTVGDPLFGCQTVIPLFDTHPGAMYRLETLAGDDLGSFCCCWHAVNVHIGRQLVAGEFVRAQPFWASNRCEGPGPESDWREVVKPDERIRPVLLPVLIENDQLIRVDNQISGGELTVVVRDGEGLPETTFGPRPANPDPAMLEIALAEPLLAGQQVKVTQELCARIEESDWVTVLPLPPVVDPPKLLPPLYACAGRVHVYDVDPGATVRVFQDGFIIGQAWAGARTSLSIPVAPHLVEGGEVHAAQWVGGIDSGPSDPVVAVRLEELPRPRIIEPVAIGDTRVLVSGVPPGSRVGIMSGGALIGQTEASEPMVSVPVVAVSGALRARVALCEVESTGAVVEPIADPVGPGSFLSSGSRSVSYTPDYSVPVHGDEGGFDDPIAGRLYFPADANGNELRAARPRPLIVIAHGLWQPNEDSYLGYGYLAHHLARWGAYVVSLDLDVVNQKTSTTSTQQTARGEIILEATRRLIADPDLEGRIDRERIGLVGHSMGGEGVVAAQDLNLAAAAPLGIRGVVSIAPTNWRPDIALRGAKYLQLLGSRDQLVSSTSAVSGIDPRFGGFRLFDRAERPKTHVWIYEARHNGFNTEWFNGLNVAETTIVDQTLGLGEHQTIAKAFICSFFQDALHGDPRYAGYLEGPVSPRAVQGFDVYTQHLGPGAVVVDDFGDADGLLGHAEEALDKVVNRQSGDVDATGGGLTVWEDREYIDILHAVHDTKGLDLAWSAPDVVYETDTASVPLGDTSWLSVRIAQFYEDDVANFPGVALDVLIGLADSTTEVLVRLGLVADAPYPDTFRDPLSVLHTGRLPLDAFTVLDPALDLSAIRHVRVLTAAKGIGHLLLDDIEFIP